MQRICYQVIASLPDEAAEREYVAWLEDGHVDAVISGGAHSAMIVRLEPAPGAAGPLPRVLTQYIFVTRERFDRYLEHAAPALRAEGLRRFPPDRGVSFERMVGEIV